MAALSGGPLSTSSRRFFGGTAMFTTARHARRTRSSRGVLSGLALVSLVGASLVFGVASAQAQSTAPRVGQVPGVINVVGTGWPWLDVANLNRRHPGG